MMALVLDFTSNCIFALQNMASIGDFEVKSYPIFMNFAQPL